MIQSQGFLLYQIPKIRHDTKPAVVSTHCRRWPEIFLSNTVFISKVTFLYLKKSMILKVSRTGLPQIIFHWLCQYTHNRKMLLVLSFTCWKEIMQLSFLFDIQNIKWNVIDLGWMLQFKEDFFPKLSLSVSSPKGQEAKLFPGQQDTKVSQIACWEKSEWNKQLCNIHNDMYFVLENPHIQTKSF